MNVYENLVVGNFLFDLGVRMARLRPNLPLISVNMFQQTPMDACFADVLLANPSVCRIVEFKRKRNKSKKELKKLKKLQAHVEKYRGWEPISAKIHWYIEIEDGTSEKPDFTVEACPYLYFRERSKFVSMENFAARAAEEACSASSSSSAENNQRYLKVLRSINSEVEGEMSDEAKDALPASSGVFTVAIQKDGRTNWVAVPSIEQMFMEQRLLEKSLGIEREPPGYQQNMGYGIG